MNRVLKVATIVFTSSVIAAPIVSAQLQGYDRVYRVQFPDGYAVLKQPNTRSEVVKRVPDPTEASVKGQFNNQAGEVFYLSDWSWDRRMRGQSHFWMFPLAPRQAPPPDPAPTGNQPEVQVLSQAQKVEFPRGFVIVEGASKQARGIKKVAGPTEATVKAYVDIEGERFYMSDWSYERAVRGESANWMRAVGRVETDAPPRGPRLPDGYRLSEFETDRIFERGYDRVADPFTRPRISSRVSGPARLRVVVEVSGDRNTFFLEADDYRRWRNGEEVSWLRDRIEEGDPGVLPRMRDLARGTGMTFRERTYPQDPWRFSTDLYPHDPRKSLVALREFGIESDLTEIAWHHEDREFPYLWLTEVARHLENRGALDRAIETLRSFQSDRERLLRLYEESGDYEMEESYARDRIVFDQRFLALLESERDRHAEAERWLSPLVRDWDPTSEGLNASGPRMNMLRDLARAQWRQGKSPDARVSTRRWLGAYARNIANDLLHPDYIDASQRVMEFDSDFEAVGEYFELLDAVTEPAVAAEIVIGLKGLRLAVATSRQVQARHSADPALTGLARELIRLEEQQREANLAGKEQDRERERRIAEIHAELSLRRLSGAHVELANHPEWVRLSREIERLERSDPDSWDITELEEERDLVALDHLIEEGNFIARPSDIARQLRPGEVLVDFFFVPPSRLDDIGRYGAVLLHADGRVDLARLGSSEPIDAMVAEFRELMKGANIEDPTLDRQVATVLRRGSELVLGPVQERLSSSESLVFCADGQLLFLPFGSLEDDSGVLAQDRWEITYVNAARDLLRERRAPARDRTALLVGNPSFESSSGATGSRGRALRLDEEVRAALARASRGLLLPPLPGTKSEVEALAPRLEEAGFRVMALMEESATESRFTSFEVSPTILHLATHGFFLDELPLPDRSTSEKADSAMLRGGLALTRAQDTLKQWESGRVPATHDDGILLAAEVAQLDLSGTEIVVLSACDTAVGRARGGEGVEGLRSGLTLAGAQNVLLTLWPVSDHATVEVMRVFYEKLLGGTPAPIALAETKRELFHQFAEEEGEYIAHYFVAPFLVTRSGSLR